MSNHCAGRWILKSWIPLIGLTGGSLALALLAHDNVAIEWSTCICVSIAIVALVLYNLQRCNGDYIVYPESVALLTSQEEGRVNLLQPEHFATCAMQFRIGIVFWFATGCTIAFLKMLNVF